MDLEIKYRGRVATTEDVALINELIAQNPGDSRYALSKKLCRAWNFSLSVRIKRIIIPKRAPPATQGFQVHGSRFEEEEIWKVKVLSFSHLSFFLTLQRNFLAVSVIPAKAKKLDSGSRIRVRDRPRRNDEVAT